MNFLIGLATLYGVLWLTAAIIGAISEERQTRMLDREERKFIENARICADLDANPIDWWSHGR